MQTLGFKKNTPVQPIHPPQTPSGEKVNTQKDAKEKPQDTKLKRPRGRPRTKPPVAAGAAGVREKGDTLLYLPPPPAPNLRRSPGGFFKYWNGLTPEMAEHVEVRIYRIWPSINRLASGENKKDIATIEKVNPFGVDWQKGMLDRFGCGDYNVYMLEVPGGAKVCMTFVELGRDFYNHPPVLNKKELLEGDPANAGFISWLKQHNEFDPTADDKKKNSEDEKLNKERDEEMSAVETLSQTVVELSKQQRQQAPIPIPVPSRSAEDVATIYKDAATAGIRMVEEAAAKVNDSKTTAADPIKQIEAVIGMVTSMKGDNGMLEAILKQSEERAARAEERANQLFEKLVLNPSTTAPAQKTLLETLEEHQKLNELMGIGKKRRSSSDDDEEDDAKPADSLMGLVTQNLPVIAPMIQGIFGAIAYYGANVMYNMTAAKTGTAVPVAPTAPNAPTTIPAQPAGTQAGVQMQPAPAQQQQPEYTLTEEQQQFAPFHPFLATIQPALIKHLSDDSLDGYTFAQWLIESSVEGRLHYDQLKQAGIKNIMLLLKSYPPLWSILAPSEWRVEKMVTMFLDYDAMRERQEREDEEEDEEGVENATGN